MKSIIFWFGLASIYAFPATNKKKDLNLINGKANNNLTAVRYFTDELYGTATFHRYMSYEEMMEYIERIENEYNSVVTVKTIGKSVEKREIKALIISNDGDSNSSRPKIFIDGGIHAREWIAPAMVIYIINQLLENYENEDLYEEVDWIIVPIVNPDGYEFSRNTKPMWRKNRAKGIDCDGVDLNRNFEFHWNEGQDGTDECENDYPGPRPFSEPEARAIRDFLLSMNNVKLYLTFHSYGTFILYPWGYTKNAPDNVETLRLLANDVRKAILGSSGTDYKVESASEMYVAPGGSDDYALSIGVDFSYTIELPGGGTYGFDLPENEIIRVVAETFVGIKVFHDYIKNHYK